MKLNKEDSKLIFDSALAYLLSSVEATMTLEGERKEACRTSALLSKAIVTGLFSNSLEGGVSLSGAKLDIVRAMLEGEASMLSKKLKELGDTDLSMSGSFRGKKEKLEKVIAKIDGRTG